MEQRIRVSFAQQSLMRSFGASVTEVAPGRVERRVSQIDIAPTVLGLLGMDYDSRFYGVDIFQLPPGRERAFIGTYQLLGYLRDDKLVQLSPHRKVDTLRPAFDENSVSNQRFASSSNNTIGSPAPLAQAPPMPSASRLSVPVTATPDLS